ncbi:hypothetical protein BH09VER1_BH09VER1_26070 [soil metagenome]
MIYQPFFSAWFPELLAKGTVIMLASLTLDLICREYNPKTRVILLRFAICSLFSLPIFMGCLPRWTLERPAWTHLPAQAARLITTEEVDPPPLPHEAIYPPQSSPQPSGSISTASSPLTFSQIAFATWLVGIAFFLTRLILGHIMTRRLLQRTTDPSPDIMRWTAEVSHALGLKSSLTVRLSPLISTPLLIGCWSPQVLLPVGLFDQSSKRDWEAVLAHEAAHLRNLDPIWRLIYSLSVSLIWFHPFVWLMRRAHSSAIEELADVTASAYVGDHRHYEQTLAAVALKHYAWYISCTALPMASRGSLLSRLARLPKNLARRPLGRFPLGLACLLAAATLTVGAALTWAQIPPEEKGPIPQKRTSMVLKCIGSDGQPVAGAKVYLSEDRGFFAETVSDAHGMAEFPGSITLDDNQNQGSVLAVVPGKLVGGCRFPYESSPKEGNAFLISMLPTTHLKGRVQTIGGLDPRQSTVSLSWNDESPNSMAGTFSAPSNKSPLWSKIYQCTPNADGSFEFEDAPKNAMVFLCARAPGYGDSRAMLRNGNWESMSLLLQPAACLRGKVVQKENGLPLGKVLVYIRLQGTVMWTTTLAETDEEGKFSFSGLTEGKYDVSVHWSEGRVMLPTDVILKAGDVATVILLMEKGTPISGQITFEGRPVPKATLIVMDRGSESLISAETDDQGRYQINLPDGLSQLYLTSIPEGIDYQTESLGWDVNMVNGKVIDSSPDFALKRRPPVKNPSVPVTAKGRIVDSSGQPIADVPIFFLRHPLKGAEDYTDEEGAGFSGPCGLSNQDGIYELSLLPFGEYQITAGGQTTSTAKSRKFQTASGSSHHIEDLVVRPANATAFGLIVDAAGQPIADVVLKSSSKNKEEDYYSPIRSDPSGNFHFDHLLPDEPFSVVAYKAGYGEMRKTFLPGETNLRFVLSSEK